MPLTTTILHRFRPSGKGRFSSVDNCRTAVKTWRYSTSKEEGGEEAFYNWRLWHPTHDRSIWPVGKPSPFDVVVAYAVHHSTEFRISKSLLYSSLWVSGMVMGSIFADLFSVFPLLHFINCA
jgi:hypothetical protein